ncbi:MAG: hypothetical protein A2Z72_08325 [Omnitrophica bacterium RBG_13_46_9]|nr:MAG: hypothetical protein A2Z72_08325 [Omnitrophica bacterium RBG_13_46_9]
MDKTDNYIAILSDNQLELIQVILYGWFRNLKLMVTSEDFRSRILTTLKPLFFMKRYIGESITSCNMRIAEHKGLHYKISEEAIGLTLEFYNQNIKSVNRVVGYYNRILNTKKFEAYIKKVICHQVFILLKALYVITLSGRYNKKILISANTVNKFIVKHMEDKYKIKYGVRWVTPSWKLFFLFAYYAWLIKEFIRRGLVFNRNKKNYKLSKEALSGTYNSVLGDDVEIDGRTFKKEDILMVQFSRAPQRDRAFKEAIKMGFNTACVPDLKININRNLFGVLFFYFLIPLKSYFLLFADDRSHLFYYIVLFHKRCFPIEILLNLYNIKCYISNKVWGDIEETIVLNKYGTKNIIFHLNDLTAYRVHTFAFIAHNIYFTWGDIHYDCHSANYFVDKKLNIGCPYKRSYNEACNNKEEIIKQIPNFKKEKKTVVFFDTAFDNSTYCTEEFLLQYLSLIKEFCDNKGKELNILLKPKGKPNEERGISQENRERYEKLWKGLLGCEGFILIDSLKWDAEKIMSISDVCVNMGINSPGTIALICGKNALYFDATGNEHHPFAKKYKDILVFEDKNLLFKQIENILNGKFNCRRILTKEEIRLYDAFDDDRALDRLRENLNELTSQTV